MARKLWTVVVFSDDRSPVRQIRLSREVAQATIAAALLAAALLGFVGVRLLSRGTEALRDHGMAQRAAFLQLELASMEMAIDSLGRSLAALEEKDAFYRLLAGLEPLDSDIRMVGIGGPGMATLEGNALYDLDAGLAGRVHTSGSELSALVRRARLLSFSWREARQTLQQKIARLQATPSILPAEGWVSSGFTASRWHPILSRPRPHLGLDIVAPRGTPIVATARGRVRRVGIRGEYGLTVEIDHGFGTTTLYAHASKALVRVGQPVERGDVIGLVGATGLAFGPHLHYEVMINGRPTNPRRFIFEADAMPD